ncbi:SH3 domain-containing protein [Candidatus Latescibacterota bacterium]
MRAPLPSAPGVLAAILAWALLSAAPGRAETILAIDRDQVNIREDATVRARRLAVLQRGDEVAEVRRHNEWVQIRLPDGRAGWIHSQLVQERLVVEGQGVRVRTSASSRSASVTMLYRGQEVGKVGQRGNWYEVRMSDGQTGWVYGRYLRPKTDADARAAQPRQAIADEVDQAVAARPAPATESARPAAPASAPVAQTVPEPAAAEPVVENPSAPTRDGEAASRGVEEEGAVVHRDPYGAALQYEAAGEYGRALTSFEEVLAADPDHVNALIHAAKANRQLGQPDEALEKLYHALGLTRGRKDLYLTLGEVYRLQGEADSSAKYHALFRGEELPVTEELDAPPEAEDGEGLPVLRLALALTLLILLIALATWLVLRKGSAARPEGKSTRRGRKFDRALEQGAAATRAGQVRPEGEEELDRQIEDKWRELRESSALFAASWQPSGDEGVDEEAHLSRILDQVEALRRALDLQDERAGMYADIVRLQNMKVEAMKEELKLLRGRRR